MNSVVWMEMEHVSMNSRFSIQVDTEIGEGNGNPLQSAFLPGESHGQRSLEGHGPQCRRESETTKTTKYASTQIQK